MSDYDDDYPCVACSCSIAEKVRCKQIEPEEWPSVTEMARAVVQAQAQMEPMQHRRDDLDRRIAELQAERNVVIDGIVAARYDEETLLTKIPLAAVDEQRAGLDAGDWHLTVYTPEQIWRLLNGEPLDSPGDSGSEDGSA